MAISLAFGIVFATVITLLLVPSLYMILGDLDHWWSAREGARRDRKSVAARPPAGETPSG
jgi:uncharacterized membrane protein YdfJ with MMPL/SSD domain